MNTEERKGTASPEQVVQDEQTAIVTDEPKTAMYTQEQMDNAIEARLRRVRRQYKDYDDYKAIADTVREKGGIAGETPKDVLDGLTSFYDGGNTQAERPTAEVKKTTSPLSAEERVTLAELNAQKFVKQASDDDLEDEYERLQSKGKRRSDEEDARFEIVRGSYEKSKIAKGTKQQLDAFTKKYPGVTLEDLKADPDFVGFAKVSKEPLLETYELYTALTGKAKAAKKEIGSVSSSGPASEKAEFSFDEVSAMSPAEVKKNMDAIKRSMPKWKR